MKRTISVMVGKGSVNHNTRKFKAANVESERTHQNITYCNQPIKQVYHELFDEALERYNTKQNRADRRIENYYEKIRTGKQEKLFHEVILQIGNKDNMAVVSEDGALAAQVLDEYMKAFQNRNPSLFVFSACMHMDEATPHLHIDFVPYTTGSKRGLDTRVSLKQALAAQGFAGGSRGDTEWNQWVRAEKEELAQVMQRHGIEWEQLGTHDEHLSVMNYKKVQRAKEVAQLEGEIGKQAKHLETVETKLKAAKGKEQFVTENARQYDDDPEYQLIEPKPLMSAKTYHDKVAAPLVAKLKAAIRSILVQFIERTRASRADLNRAYSQIDGLSRRVEQYEKEWPRLKDTERDFNRLEAGIGKQEACQIIEQVKEREESAKKAKRIRTQDRSR